MKSTRRASALLAALAGIALIAGCGSSDAGSEESTASSDGGNTQSSSSPSGSTQSTSSQAELPTIAGAYGEAPEFTFGESGPPEGLQVKVLSEGDGPTVQPGVPVLANYAGVVWGETEPFDSSFSRGEPSLFSLKNVVAGWTQGIPGHAVGSRLLISIPPDLGYGPSGGNPAAGIGAEDTIVFVVDLVKTYNPDQTGQADAQIVTPVDELPVEVSGDLGEPATLTVPEGAAAPEEPQTIVIAEGSGDPVTSGQTVVIAFAMSSWDGATSKSTWPAGEKSGSGPIAAPTGRGAIVDELVDVPVGSRVLLLVPKSQQAPPAAFVMDVLAAK